MTKVYEVGLRSHWTKFTDNKSSVHIDFYKSFLQPSDPILHFNWTPNIILTFEIVCGIACLHSERDKDEAKKFLTRDEEYFAPYMN